MADGRGLPGLVTYGDDATNRLLSAAAHLDEDFARETAVELIEDRLEALGPSLGVDLVAVARHARAAASRADLKDALLTGLLAAVAGGIFLRVYGSVGHRPELLVWSRFAIVGGLLAAWVLVLAAEHRARTLALRVIRDEAAPGELAPPLGPAVEAALREQERANAIPYHEGAEQDSPFVGSGRAFQERVWQPIDVSTPAANPSGGEAPDIIPFDVVDLHGFVAEQMGNIAGLEGLRTQDRMYVLGTRVLYAGQTLLPDPLARPRPVVPPEMLRAGLTRPGAGMRTYLCLERAGEGGRVIVSMHLRARLQHPSLTWEVAAYVIPPLRSGFEEARKLRLDPFGRWWTLVAFTTRRFLPALCKAPARLLRRGWERGLRWARLRYWRWVIGRRHIEFDYGATGGIRERAGDWERMGFSEQTDAVDFLQRLQQGVLTATERFLKAHNVDTSSFEKAQRVINHHSYTFQGPINGPGNFGAGGTVSMAGSPGPSPAAGGGAPPPAPAKS
ncbi:hypothetical protein [Streptomyces sp. NBC_00091]|uniref:hypothetical protein n=1 Tax=Streptomyces sp. NBC_00091 TaxID=2975648 RepID=UPI002257497A|nr:hypothetical protein [Streptomyces sp. NBC_00091]MCX5375198.1 hypothetical protein [Streptomyces sp. NBC_00091]